LVKGKGNEEKAKAIGIGKEGEDELTEKAIAQPTFMVPLYLWASSGNELVVLHARGASGDASQTPQARIKMLHRCGRQRSFACINGIH